MPKEKFKPFRDIWLLNAEGRVIFERISKTRVDTGFIKMLLDGLSDFVSDYFHDEVTNFKLGNQIFTFLKTDDFYFIGSSKLKTNTKKIKKKLIKVLETLRESFV
jgi:hypothetical protein